MYFFLFLPILQHAQDTVAFHILLEIEEETIAWNLIEVNF